MSPRSLIACWLAAFVVMGSIARAGDPAAIGANPGIKIDLKTQLEKGLKARRPVEFKYIEELVVLVEAEAIPRSLIDSTFIWARKQPQRPLQHFQFALKARGDKLGIVTPSLKDQFVDPVTGKLPPSK
jgi:hypothetical protein